MLCQTHIGYQYWQMPVRNSMPPTSRISKHQASWANGHLVNVRYTVENCLGAWPGDNRHNCPLGYACPDPTLLPMDQFGQPRWVEVGSGGPEDFNFTAEADHDWVKVEPSSGSIKSDGSTDTRVYISIDWTKAKGDTVHVTFSSDDKATPMIVTIPIIHLTPPPDFLGAVQGDGYICLEASHHVNTSSSSFNGTEYRWEEIPFYGRTHSGMSVYPVENYHLPAESRPSIRYDFWTTSSTDCDLIFHIGPTNNYVLGSRLAFAIQIDDQEVVEIEPIPEAPHGELSADWEDIVAKEIREVKLKVKLGKEGSHTLRVFGITPGIVLERVMIDLGGIAERGYSYLGPVESVIL